MRAYDPLLIDPGELIHQVQVQKASATRDAAGQPVSTWDLVLSAYAKIEGTGSRSYRESFSDNALASESTGLITIRWPGENITIAPGMRVIFENNTYLVQAVDNVQHRNRKLLLACMMVDEDSN